MAEAKLPSISSTLPGQRAGMKAPASASSSTEAVAGAAGDVAARKQIRGSSLLLVGRVLSVGVNFGIQILIVRYLTKADYGAFAYALSLVALGSSIATFGLDRSITWTNRPGVGAFVTAGGAAPLGTWVDFDLTGAVAGNGTYSFALQDGSSDVARYHSKEAANDPQLVVTFGS